MLLQYTRALLVLVNLQYLIYHRYMFNVQLSTDCDCHPKGSLETQCALYDGQCPCKDNVGGKQCDECQVIRETEVEVAVM